MRNQIYHRPIRFDQVICKIKCIQLTVMMQPECRMKPGCYKASGNITSYHSITVIQSAVDRIFRSLVKTFMKATKICFCGKRFDTVSIFDRNLVSVFSNLLGSKRSDNRSVLD